MFHKLWVGQLSGGLKRGVPGLLGALHFVRGPPAIPKLQAFLWFSFGLPFNQGYQNVPTRATSEKNGKKAPRVLRLIPGMGFASRIPGPGLLRASQPRAGAKIESSKWKPGRGEARAMAEASMVSTASSWEGQTHWQGSRCHDFTLQVLASETFWKQPAFPSNLQTARPFPQVERAAQFKPRLLALPAKVWTLKPQRSGGLSRLA